MHSPGLFFGRDFMIRSRLKEGRNISRPLYEEHRRVEVKVSPVKAKC